MCVCITGDRGNYWEGTIVAPAAVAEAEKVYIIFFFFFSYSRAICFYFNLPSL